jgi:ABC-2 type transport system ATP-binding protein
MLAVEARNLVKRFRVAVKRPGLAGAFRHLMAPRHEQRTAVDGIELAIAPGERVAYLGPNGAGKSTTIKMLTGILRPTAGEVRVCGLRPDRDRIAHARNIGVVFGQRTQLWWDLPVIESFRLLGDIYELPRAVFARNLETSIELLQLESILRTPVRSLSLGQRMQCDVVAALLHQPAVLFLDEPSIGLDLDAKERIRALICDAAERHRTTILLTSHDLGDIEGICDRIVIIDRGVKLFDGSMEHLLRRFADGRVMEVLLFDSTEQAALDVQQRLRALGPVVVELSGLGRVRIQFDPNALAVEDLLARILAATRVRDVRIEAQSIQDVVRKVYQGQLASEPEP